MNPFRVGQRLYYVHARRGEAGRTYTVEAVTDDAVKVQDTWWPWTDFTAEYP